MCACNELEERQHLISLRKALSGLKGEKFFEVLAINAKQVIFISGEAANRYNALIYSYRFKTGNEEQRQEIKEILDKLILG